YGEHIAEVSSWDTLDLWIPDAGNITAARLMERTIGKTAAPGDDAAARIDSSPTKATWADDTKQHAMFTFSAAQTMFANPGTGEFKRDVWMILRVVTSTGETFTVATGRAVAYKDGHSSTAAPTPGDTAFYTASQIEALFVKKSALSLE